MSNQKKSARKKVKLSLLLQKTNHFFLGEVAHVENITDN